MAKETKRRRQWRTTRGGVYGSRARLFGEFFTRGIGHDGQVRIPWCRQSEALLQPDLARRGLEQVDAADDLGDALCRIVDDDSQLIGKLPVGAQEYEVANGALEVLPDVALHAIIKGDLAVGDAHSPGAGCSPNRQTVTADARVNQPAIHSCWG